MLNKTNYVEWSMVMKVKMQAWRMWDVVRYGDANFDEDRRALEALLAAVPTDMHSSLANKETANDAWDAIVAARIGSNRTCRSTLSKLRQEWENLAFWARAWRSSTGSCVSGITIFAFTPRVSSMIANLKLEDEAPIIGVECCDVLLSTVASTYEYCSYEKWPSSWS
ncbi:uncharacterized protein [Miscanthus floridulus]|uniref:uncharacterized protein n=1 Tax=Miscanthus floridulus TaxID=154761 RepID=UPI00345B0486